MQYNADADLRQLAWDFGLAEVYEHSSNTREVTIPPAGRMGYLAPEYVYSAVPTEKTYVYSFGVVVLEVATGRRPVDDDGTVVVDWVWDLREKGKKRPRMLKDQILYQRIREQRSGLLLLLALP
uniref:Protein kinase domain-containing protein n=1 Tax=Salix viminalis TaxID=40686 RepID=A0A6N2L0S4_SALVM